MGGGNNHSLPRVLYAAALNPSIKFGSLEEQALELALAFRDSGGLFLPLFESPPTGDTAAAFLEAGVEADGLDLHDFSWSRLSQLLALIRKHRIDLVHWNFYHPMNPYVAGLSLRAPHLRHVLTDHNSRIALDDSAKTGLGGRLRELFLRRYAKVFCVSEFVRDARVREGGGDREVVATHFVNTERFQPCPETRARLRANFDGDFVALVVAHLIPEKGVDVMLEALAKLPPELRVWVVGEGVYRNTLERMARELGVRDRVDFLGSQVYVEPFMQAADCLVCPSRWAEAAGLVNIEGLACGLPVVASRIGGIPEIVAHDRNGILVEVGDAGALANALQRLIDDPVYRGRLAQQARVDALAAFSAEGRIGDYLDRYRAVAPS